MFKKWLFIILGSITFILGTVGIFVPILPTVPFYLLTAYFWINSSTRLYNYFVNSHYYRIYVKEMILEKKITKQKLIKMLLMVFLVLLIPFLIFDSLHVRIILVIVFAAHLVFGYFYFRKK